MKAVNLELTKEIKGYLKVINASMKELENAEIAQSETRNVREYDNQESVANNAVYDMMQALEGAVAGVSSLGCCHSAYDINTYHHIESSDIRENLK